MSINTTNFTLNAWNNNIGVLLKSSPNNSSSDYYFAVGNTNNYLKFAGDGTFDL